MPDASPTPNRTLDSTGPNTGKVKGSVSLDPCAIQAGGCEGVSGQLRYAQANGAAAGGLLIDAIIASVCFGMATTQIRNLPIDEW